jgi:AcrR family transcriptional regulator
MQEVFVKRATTDTSGRLDAKAEAPARSRILVAAFKAFTENGYAGTSTLKIATRAKVSKRELYTHFGNKQAMLVACIASRVTRMRPPPDLPMANNRGMLGTMLETFGSILLREACHPWVLAVFRLAIAEAIESPEVAQVLNSEARQTNRAVLSKLLTQAQAAGLLRAGDPTEMTETFLALLWKDLMVGLLLQVAKPPTPTDIERQAQSAAWAFLKIYPEP